jgi:MoaA/NifB/PqqE/SkfB family radical SAM enzyme
MNLTRTGFLRKGDFNFERELSRLDDIDVVVSGKSIIPLYADISPSGQCNQRCLWCVGKSKQEFLSFDVMNKLIDELHLLKVDGIVLDGSCGEPLLNLHTVDVGVKATEYDMCVGLGTNGTLLGNYDLTKVSNFTYIRISIDAATSSTYGLLKKVDGSIFNEIIKNVDILTNIKMRFNKSIRIGFSFILRIENMKEIHRIAEISSNLGVDYLQFKTENNKNCDFEMMQCVNYAKNSFPNINIYLEAFRPVVANKCFIQYLIPAIGADGNVYTCCENESNSHFSFGNIYSRSFEDIWFSDRDLDTEQCYICSRHNYRINKFFGDIYEKNKKY